MSSPGKYRAWDEDCEVMYYSDAGWNKAHPESEDCIFDFHKGHVVAFLRQTEPGTIDEPPYDYGKHVDVEQETGKHDGKHNDIYAGDILKSLSNNRALEVFWSEAQCAFMVRSSGNANLLADWNLDNFETIGNISENPELLEGK